MYRVRFHLAAGEHYRHWQVRGPSGSVTYHDPAAVSLTLRGCRLVVRPGAAARVHAAGVKDVCGWIECESVTVTPPLLPFGASVRFNPIESVHWYVGFEVADGLSVGELITTGREVIAPPQ